MTEDTNNNNHDEPREDAETNEPLHGQEGAFTDMDGWDAIEEPIIDLANTLQELSDGATMTLDYDDPLTGQPLPDGERVIFVDSENMNGDQEALLLEVVRVTGNDRTAASPIDGELPMSGSVKFYLQKNMYGPQLKDQDLMLRCYGAYQTDKNIPKVVKQLTAVVEHIKNFAQSSAAHS